MNLDGMDRTVNKLIMITDKRLRALRTKEITEVQNADYYKLLRDIDWYHRVKRSIQDAKGGTATATAHMFALLNERVGDHIKDIDDHILDNIRMAGAGMLPNSLTTDNPKYDVEFLESCGIKGETW